MKIELNNILFKIIAKVLLMISKERKQIKISK
jgi:hypothetical protein